MFYFKFYLDHRSSPNPVSGRSWTRSVDESKDACPLLPKKRVDILNFKLGRIFKIILLRFSQTRLSFYRTYFRTVKISLFSHQQQNQEFHVQAFQKNSSWIVFRGLTGGQVVVGPNRSKSVRGLHWSNDFEIFKSKW